jgi:hypothetical protein
VKKWFIKALLSKLAIAWGTYIVYTVDFASLTILIFLDETKQTVFVYSIKYSEINSVKSDSPCTVFCMTGKSEPIIQWRGLTAVW